MPNTIERIDGYAKHHFSQLVTWFTFFSTVNWAVLGWIPGNINDANSTIISMVAGAFALKNLLGVFMCLGAMNYFVKTSKRLDDLEDENNKQIFPMQLVVATCVGMVLAIILVMSIWLQIWYNY